MPSAHHRARPPNRAQLVAHDHLGTHAVWRRVDKADTEQFREWQRGLFEDSHRVHGGSLKGVRDELFSPARFHAVLADRWSHRTTLRIDRHAQREHGKVAYSFKRSISFRDPSPHSETDLEGHRP